MSIRQSATPTQTTRVGESPPEGLHALLAEARAANAAFARASAPVAPVAPVAPSPRAEATGMPVVHTDWMADLDLDIVRRNDPVLKHSFALPDDNDPAMPNSPNFITDPRWTLVDVPGDGSCFAHAVFEAMNTPHFSEPRSPAPGVDGRTVRDFRSAYRQWMKTQRDYGPEHSDLQIAKHLLTAKGLLEPGRSAVDTEITKMAPGRKDFILGFLGSDFFLSEWRTHPEWEGVIPEWRYRVPTGPKIAMFKLNEAGEFPFTGYTRSFNGLYAPPPPPPRNYWTVKELAAMDTLVIVHTGPELYDAKHHYQFAVLRPNLGVSAAAAREVWRDPLRGNPHRHSYSELQLLKQRQRREAQKGQASSSAQGQAPPAPVHPSAHGGASGKRPAYATPPNERRPAAPARHATPEYVHFTQFNETHPYDIPKSEMDAAQASLNHKFAEMRKGIAEARARNDDAAVAEVKARHAVLIAEWDRARAEFQAEKRRRKQAQEEADEKLAKQLVEQEEADAKLARYLSRQ